MLASGLATNPNRRIDQGQIQSLAQNPNAKVVSWAQTFEKDVKRDYTTPPHALPVPGVSLEGPKPEAIRAQQVAAARGGHQRLQAQAIELRPVAEEKAVAVQGPNQAHAMVQELKRLNGIDPTKATPDEARLLGKHAVLAQVHHAISEGGPSAGLARAKELESAFSSEALDARVTGRSRSLENMVERRVAPASVDQILPQRPDVKAAYLKGMEEAVLPAPGGISPARQLCNDARLTALAERTHVQGMESVRGLVATGMVRQEVNVGRLENGIRDALAPVSYDVRQQAADQLLSAVQTARQLHAQAAASRGITTLQQSMKLPGMDVEASVRVEMIASSPQELQACRRALEDPHKQRVASEFGALQEYNTERLKALSAVERGDMPAAFHHQERAVDAFYKVVDAGLVSPETQQAIRNAKMDPVHLHHHVKGVESNVANQKLGKAQLELLRDEIGAAENVRTFLYQKPGAVFQTPLPIAAYQHEGLTQLAALQGSRVERANLETASGDVNHPLHEVAVAWERAQVQDSSVGEGRLGFREMDLERPALAGPHQAVQLHVGWQRTPATAVA
jgi:hypothetical protein